MKTTMDFMCETPDLFCCPPDRLRLFVDAASFGGNVAEPFPVKYRPAPPAAFLQVSWTQRNPWWPVELSGVLEVRAATR